MLRKHKAILSKIIRYALLLQMSYFLTMIDVTIYCEENYEAMPAPTTALKNETDSTKRRSLFQRAIIY